MTLERRRDSNVLAARRIRASSGCGSWREIPAVSRVPKVETALGRLADRSRGSELVRCVYSSVEHEDWDHRARRLADLSNCCDSQLDSTSDLAHQVDRQTNACRSTCLT